MPKLRQNIVTGEWVVIAPERAKRPEDFVVAAAPKRNLTDQCPFCLENPNSAYQQSIKEAETEHFYCINNKFPAFAPSDSVIQEGGELYFSTKAVGGHEVLIQKNHHKEIYEGGWENLAELFGLYKSRYLFYEQDAAIEYAMPIHNLGPEAGASIEHPHSQFFASSIVPNRIIEEMSGAKLYYADKGKCVFCAMVEEEKNQNIRIIAENDDFLAFNFFASRFPFEIWIIPKRHSASFEKSGASDLDNFAKIVYDVLSKLNNALKYPPFNWWVHTGPTKKDHLDSYFHWHMEIAPRVSKFGGYELGSGIVIDVVSPELAAQFLKKA